MSRSIPLTIIAGDFNKSLAETRRELSSLQYTCSTHETRQNSYRGNNSLDHIFIKKNKDIHIRNHRSEWNHRLEDMESIRESYQTFIQNRTSDNMPVNPSDHGILHLDLQVGNANIGVVSWNVMTQGLYRTEKHLAQQKGKALRKPNDLIKEQTFNILQSLGMIFSNNHIDIVCLQEYGGVWDEYYNIPRLNHYFKEQGLHFINGERYHEHRPSHRRLPVNESLRTKLMSIPQQGLKRGRSTWVLLNHFNGRIIFVRGNIIDFDKLRQTGISRRVDARKGKQTAFADIYIDKSDTKISLTIGCRHGQKDIDTPPINMQDLADYNINKLSRRIRGEGIQKHTKKRKTKNQKTKKTKKKG